MRLILIKALQNMNQIMSLYRVQLLRTLNQKLFLLPIIVLFYLILILVMQI
jgi:hypothetical protein